jgi:hypothetical protein
MKKIKNLIKEEIKKIQLHEARKQLITEQLNPPSDTSCPGGSGCNGEVAFSTSQGDGCGGMLPNWNDPDWVGVGIYKGCSDCGDGNLGC